MYLYTLNCCKPICIHPFRPQAAMPADDYSYKALGEQD